jgi:predicted dehydrogenase
MDKVRFAVIGVGGFGRKRIDAIMKSEHSDLIYLVDVNKSIVKDMERSTGAEAISFEQLLLKNDYDVAIIATPNKWHEELAIRLLRTGKDVWCEKPMSISIESAKKMLEESIRTKRILKVGSNVRYFPNVVRSIELLRDGFAGRVLFFRGCIGNEGAHLLKSEWYTKKDMIGGGTLLDNGVHLIDLIRYLICEITECYMCKCTNLKWRLDDIEDNAIAVYGLSNGGIATVHSSWTDKSGYMYFEVHGEDGYLHVDSRWSKAILTYGKSYSKPSYEDFTSYPKMSYDLELEDFINDYRREFHPKPTSYDGYRAVKIIMKSYIAEQTCRPVTTFDESDRKLYESFIRTFNFKNAHVEAK